MNARRELGHGLAQTQHDYARMLFARRPRDSYDHATYAELGVKA
jgi:hypothetical protein